MDVSESSEGNANLFFVDRVTKALLRTFFQYVRLQLVDEEIILTSRMNESFQVSCLNFDLFDHEYVCYAEIPAIESKILINVMNMFYQKRAYNVKYSKNIK